MYAIIATSFILFYLPLYVGHQGAWLYFFFYAWLQVLTIVLVVSYYSLARRYVNIDQSVYIHNYISLATALGAILTTIIVIYSLPYLAIIHLLYICLLFLILNLLLNYYIVKNTPPRQQKGLVKQENKFFLFKRVFSNSYIQLIFGLTLLMLLFLIVAYYQLLMVASEMITGNQLAYFLAKLVGLIGCIHLIIQIFVSQWLLGRSGVIKNLFILPLLLLASSVLLIFKYNLITVAAVVLINVTLLETINRLVFESLFLVLSERLRAYSKSFIYHSLLPLTMVIGGCVLLFAAVISLPFFTFKLLLIGLVMLWIIALFFLAGQYQKKLTDTLSHHYLFTLDFKKVFPAWQRILSANANKPVIAKLLTSADASTQLVILDLLPDNVTSNLHAQIIDLTASENTQVVAKAIELLGKIGNRDDMELMKRFFNHSSLEVEENAIIAYARVLKNNAFVDIKNFILSGNEIQQIASMAACYRYCGEAGAQYAKQQFGDIFTNNKIRAARIIAKIEDKSFIPYLNILLIDPDQKVRYEALIACQQYPYPELLPNILQNYASNRELRTQIRYVIYHMTPTCATEIIHLYKTSSYPSETKSLLVQTMGRIRNEETLVILLDIVNKRESIQLLKAAFEALQFFNYESIYSAKIQSKLALAYEQLYQNIMIMRRAYDESGDATEAFKTLFSDTILFYTALYLLLIDIRYGHARLTRLIDLLLQHNMTLVEKNISLLQAILPDKLFLQVKDVLNYQSGMSSTRTMLSQYNLIALFNIDPWVADLAVFYAKDKPELVQLLEEYDMRPKDEQFYARLNTISLLKRADFFKNISANYLIAITELLHEKSVYAGETIFKERDPGDSLFIICDGQVSIQRGNKEIATVGPGDCIGEMAVLDRLPRSATAIAMTDVKLLRISADDFAEIALYFPEIALNLLTILAQRLRKTLANIS